MKTIRNRTGASAAKFGMGLVCIALLMVAAASFGQQPTREMESPPGVLPETTVKDYKNDPLFQEIQRMMLKGSIAGKVESNTKALDSRPSSFGGEFQFDSISDARWHAIETLFSASRSMEKDRAAFAKQGDKVGAAKTLEIVRTLRLQAVELLLAK